MKKSQDLTFMERFGFFIIFNFWKFIVFCFVGGTSAVIDLIGFNIFFFLKVPFLFSRVFATTIAIIYNFFMNRNITFGAKEHSIKKQIPRYFVVYGIAILVNLTTSMIIFSILGGGTINANLASIAGILVSIPISFLGSLFWTFKKE